MKVCENIHLLATSTVIYISTVWKHIVQYDKFVSIIFLSYYFSFAIFMDKLFVFKRKRNKQMHKRREIQVKSRKK